MKKILILLTSVLIALAFSVAFTSCGKKLDLDGIWTSDDASNVTITFFSAKNAYEVNYDGFIMNGDYEVLKGGTLKSDDDNATVILNDDGFSIIVDGESIDLVGKKISKASDINGTYIGHMYDAEFKYVFDKATSNVKFFYDGEEADSYSYSIIDQDVICLSGDMDGTYLPVNVISKDAIELDGETFIR